jgi:hypothetical protein
MLETSEFTFNRFGQITLFVKTISNHMILRIMKMCIEHARRKHTRKPVEWRFVPTLTEVA